MSIYVKKIDLLFIVLFTFFALVFLNAETGFSYDYRFYINYIEQIKNLSLIDILNMRSGPYILLSESLGIEIGFVFLVKIITLATQSPDFIFAIIAIFSLSIKALICRRLGINWALTLFIMIYSAILLESNALRSGLSLSIFILSIFQLTNRNFSLVSLVLWLLAIITHIQAAFFILLFGLFYFFKLNRHSKVITFLLFFILMLVGFWISAIISLFLNPKLIIYAGFGSVSGGINTNSILSLILVLFICWTLIQDSFFRKKNNAIFSAISSTIPALSTYIFLTEIAVLGDRLWQWGLIILCVFIYPYYPKSKLIATLKNPSNHIPKILMVFILVFGILNISIRYPLANLFYPILPYQELIK